MFSSSSEARASLREHRLLPVLRASRHEAQPFRAPLAGHTRLTRFAFYSYLSHLVHRSLMASQPSPLSMSILRQPAEAIQSLVPIFNPEINLSAFGPGASLVGAAAVVVDNTPMIPFPSKRR